MNGWPIEVDRFATMAECQEKVSLYNRAARQADGQFKVWCEARKNGPTA